MCGWMLYLEIVQELVEAGADDGIVGRGCLVEVGHLVAVTLKGTGYGEGVAVRHAQLHHYAVVGPVAVSRDVEVEEVCVTVLYGAGNA